MKTSASEVLKRYTKEITLKEYLNRQQASQLMNSLQNNPSTTTIEYTKMAERIAELEEEVRECNNHAYHKGAK